MDLSWLREDMVFQDREYRDALFGLTGYLLGCVLKREREVGIDTLEMAKQLQKDLIKEASGDANFEGEVSYKGLLAYSINYILGGIDYKYADIAREIEKELVEAGEKMFRLDMQELITYR